MRTARRALAFVVAVLGPVACDRTEPATTGRPAPPVTREPASPAPSPAETERPKKRCLVPTLSDPPPRASPAITCPVDPHGNYDLPRGYVTFVDAPGKPRVTVELTQTEAHRSRGLMYRTTMPEDEGMLFSWPDEAPRRFWMRNTCLPLDMLFIAKDGLIVGILEQVPVMNETGREVPCPAAHVLELNAGWTREHGVVAGQKVAIDGR